MPPHLRLAWFLIAACHVSVGEADDSQGTAAVCGNGLVEPGEACDLGFANQDQGRCLADCRAPACGDGIVSEGEGCDGAQDCGADCQPIIGRGRQVEFDDEFSVAEIAGTADGSFYAVGWRVGGWLALLSSTGEMQWQMDFPDLFELVGVAAVGSTVFVAGSVGSHSGNTRSWVAALDARGREQWSWTDDHERSSTGDLAIGDGGTLYVVGEQRSSADPGLYVMAFSSDGTPGFRTVDPGAGPRHAGNAIAYDPAGAVVAVGMRDDGGEAVLDGSIWIQRLDPTGRVQWTATERGPAGLFGSAVDVGLDLEGNVYAVGEVQIAGDVGGPDPEVTDWATAVWVASYTPAGERRWGAIEPIAGDGRGQSFATTVIVRPGWLLVGGSMPPAPCTYSWCSTFATWVGLYGLDGTRRVVGIEPSLGTGAQALAVLAGGEVVLAGARAHLGTKPFFAWLEVRLP